MKIQEGQSQKLGMGQAPTIDCQGGQIAVAGDGGQDRVGEQATEMGQGTDPQPIPGQGGEVGVGNIQMHMKQTEIVGNGEGKGAPPSKEGGPG